MGKLNDIITNSLTGENYNDNVSTMTSGYLKDGFKLTWEVQQDVKNFKWIIKTKLYAKRLEDTDPQYGGLEYNDIYIRISDSTKYLSTGTNARGYLHSDSIALEIFANNGTEYIKVNGNTVSSSATTSYVEIMSFNKEIECGETGRQGIRISIGQNYQDNTTNYYFSDYNNIYLTLPSFSGIKRKFSNGWFSCMPWIKVNGVWKRALQYKKVDGVWKQSKDTWIWNP